jgi:hypothetical protein
MEKKDAPSSKRPPKFQLKRESVQYLGTQELSEVVGGGASGSCCFKCGTGGTSDCRCPPPP